MDGALDQLARPLFAVAPPGCARAGALARRAGWEVGVCSTSTAWHAGLLDGERLWLVDPTGEEAGTRAFSQAAAQGHCA